MGEYRDPNHPSIRCFEPDNTDDKLYVRGSYGSETLDSLLDRAKEHFGDDVDLSKIIIEAEHIHTRCLSFDSYDPGDHEDFIVLTRQKD